jgi:ABC-2 type transport system ATP-binding protein
MEVVLQSVTKVFRHHPAFFNLFGVERRGETCALKRVSMSVAAGKILALLGPNGSGKTTLLKLVATALLPDEGAVQIGGVDTQRHPQLVLRRLGYAILNPRSFYPRLTAAENLAFFAALDEVPRPERQARIAAALASAGLTEFADLLVMKFSSGMHQRLGIARAMLKQPSVLLLDEPSNSLDPAAAVRLWQLLRQMAGQGHTVLLATHNFEEAIAVADTVAVLNRGELLTQRTLVGADVEELRRWYFAQVEGGGAAWSAVSGERR